MRGGRTGGLALLATLVLVIAGVAPVVGAAAPGGAADGARAVGGPGAPAAQSDGLNPCVGTIDEDRRPETTTLVSIQGARAGDKTAALLVGLAPNGSVVGVHNDTADGRWWSYDVDPLPNGELLMATTQNRHTVIERIDPATGETTSRTDLENVEDAHDVDYLGDGEFVTVDKGDERNRVVIFDDSGEIVWQWRFDEHADRFPEDGGGPYGTDWTHVNDVDPIGDDTLLVSVRNFDQVIAIDRDTKEVKWTLGEDDDYDVLNEQHNPDFIEGEDGRTTVIVADSENDRVVEYSRTDGGEWERTWSLSGGGLHEPRDADRLPNGNTLVTDRRGHRVLEVTPRGEVVWEVYTPWQPYDAERVGTDPGSDGPTTRQIGATGDQTMTGGTVFDTEAIESCYAHLTGVERDRLVPEDELWGTGGELGDAATATPDDGADGGSAGSADGDDADGTDREWTTVPDESFVQTPGFGAGAALTALMALAAAFALAAVRRR
ncbi:PQQ-binding-like beta-propeller repeat protein [Halobaculum sp. WSA2]|uniref:PQQ-binding-like beta-propeller repeat protein n=1 Tax=Halobaculum saliterrae TaxID=2073113 RepID=A0A6B0T0J2_9EURY|nr:aryl-sulfate sulfotransferase [Halobaculum saliterrae]MXR40129.1 PQQ-binding-like beta-propeller repeat protein [Halobaculum saliterrae]